MTNSKKNGDKNQKLKLRQNLETQKNLNFDKTIKKKSNIDKAKQNYTVTKLKNLNCGKTQELKL